MPRLNAAVRGALLITVVAWLLFAASLVSAQSLLDGYWFPLFNEDYTERIPGPDQGDYAGLPVTISAMTVARAWSPELLTEPALECRPHPVVYGSRSIGEMRIWEHRDPITQKQTQIETFMWAGPRHIWMVPHEHPGPLDQHTWQGFSTGKWVGDVLFVHTDNIKPGWTRRNGLPTDDQATFDERYMRYGNQMVQIMIVTDPQYLTEQLVKSNNWQYLPSGIMGAWEYSQCRPIGEVARAEGDVPMYMPGKNPILDEWAVKNQVPMKAADDGAATMFPEYQDHMKALPPNPSLSVIETAEKRSDNAAGE